MASKLDKLMALADQFACEQGFLAMGHSNASKDMAAGARTALQSALKAVVEDAERYRHLRDAHPADDGLWVAIGLPWSPAGVACWREDKLDSAIDAARKP